MYEADPEYALQTLQNAIAADVDWLVFCDTNGGIMPQDLTKIVGEVIDVVYQFEGAEASFELLMREILGQSSMLFTIQDFQVHCSILPGRDYANATQYHSLATIKVAVDGQNILKPVVW